MCSQTEIAPIEGIKQVEKVVEVVEPDEVVKCRARAHAAVNDMIMKVFNEMLHVDNRRAIEKILGKSTDIVDEFVDSTEAREIYLYYQPRQKKEVTHGPEGEIITWVPGGESLVQIRKERLGEQEEEGALLAEPDAIAIPPPEPLLAPCVVMKYDGTLWLDETERHQKPRLITHTRETMMEEIDHYEIVLMSPLRKYVRDHVIEETWFKILFAFIILGNIVVLCMDYHGIPDDDKAFLEKCNDVCTFLFAIEIVFHLLGCTA